MNKLELEQQQITWLPMLSVGIQSLVFTAETCDGGMIKKICGAGLTPEELACVAKAIPAYRYEISRAGIAVPFNYYVQVTDQLEIVDQMISGEDLFKQVKAGDMSNVKDWATASCTRGVMIDNKLDNFMKHQGRLYYVDFFPPLLSDRDGMVTPFVPALFNRCREFFSYTFGDVRGRFTKTLARVNMLMPERLNDFYQTIKDVLRTNLTRKENSYIDTQVRENFPDMKLIYDAKDPRPILKSISQNG